MSKPLIEIVYKDQIPKIFGSDLSDEVRAYLIEYMASFEKKYQNLKEKLIFLDLHKVTDTLNAEELQDLGKIDTLKIVVSFVGWTSETRVIARHQLQELLDLGYIDFGCLVFARKYQHTPFTKDGSKFWVIKLIHDLIQPKEAIFFDDSIDHVISVESIPGIDSRHYDTNDLIDQLQEFMKKDFDMSK